ncbi:uncharacterized protein [Littorina saxatilis]|uniref:Uncharacterized protein n=1 Tax=Littorina saxatilis TaxID=31220 RepID=A0AAN9AM91_9CAEN
MGLFLVGSFKGANLFTKLAFIFLCFAMFFGWISYCTANWGRTFGEDNNDYYLGYGVWRIGNNEDRNFVRSSLTYVLPLPTIFHADGWLLEWYGAFQAFATFGFICLNVGFFLVVLFMFVTPCKSNADLSFWNAINNIFGSICWLVAIILFGARFDKKFDTNFSERTLHYSFGLAIITFALQLAAGILLLLTKRGGGAVQSSK